MGYSYAPQSSGGLQLGKRGKHLAIAAVIILFVGTFYFVGNTMTGYVTYSESLEQQLNETHNKFLDMKAQYETCDAYLGNANSNIASLNTSLNACSTDMFSQKLAVTSCNNEKERLGREKSDLSTSLSSCRSEQVSSTESYKQLARNSVKAICCSFGDVQSGSVRNWNITNNSIVCTGNYTINCTTGESNY